MRTEKVDKHDVFPAMAGFSEAVTNVAEVRCDVTALRLVSKAKNLPLLRELSQLERLWCFDLNENSAPIIGELSSLRRLYVDGIRLDELSWLKGLARLEVLSLEGCTRVVSLEQLERFCNVSGLGITHFPKVHSLQALGKFDSLSALVVAGGMLNRMTVETLMPLSHLHSLRYLHLTNLKALDESLEPLAELTRLESLELPNFYPVEEFAKLSARLPKTSCNWFASVTPLGSIECPKCKQMSMVMLTGKRTPVLCASCDIVRIQKHDDLFKSIAAKSA
jgi:hypothetical protein